MGIFLDLTRHILGHIFEFMKKILFVLTCAALAASCTASVDQIRDDVQIIAPSDGVGSINDVAERLTSKIEVVDLAELQVPELIGAIAQPDRVSDPIEAKGSNKEVITRYSLYRRPMPNAQACAQKVRCKT